MLDMEVEMMKTAMSVLRLVCSQSGGCSSCPFMKYCHLMGYETPEPEKWEI